MNILQTDSARTRKITKRTRREHLNIAEWALQNRQHGHIHLHCREGKGKGWKGKRDGRIWETRIGEGWEREGCNRKGKKRKWAGRGGEKGKRRREEKGGEGWKRMERQGGGTERRKGEGKEGMACLLGGEGRTRGWEEGRGGLPPGPCDCIAPNQLVSH